jgi:hypothetical protein
MQATIVQLLQSMNFETRKTVTYVVLELPGAVRLQLPVDDEQAAAIIRADVGVNGAAPAAAPEDGPIEFGEPDLEEEENDDYNDPPPVVVSETETETVRVFGGVPDQIEEAPVPAPPKRPKKPRKKAAPSEAAPPPPPPEEPRVAPKYPEPLSTQAYKKMVKEGLLPENAYARTVPAVQGGYPAVQVKEGTADPQEVVGHFNQDEDGVGSC